MVIDENFTQFDEDAAWPCLIDEVDQMRVFFFMCPHCFLTRVGTLPLLVRGLVQRRFEVKSFSLGERKHHF